MTELISREAVIKTVDKLLPKDTLSKEYEAVFYMLSELYKIPTVCWIPVSEKLPEEGVMVLVTDDTGGMATVETDWCGRYENTGERFWFCSQNVTAWMPLPKPYTESWNRRMSDETD